MKAFTNRYELKYILEWKKYIQIRKEIGLLFKRDNKAGKNGKYGVISLYYDTPDLKFFWEKIDGQRQRIKVRLRTYVSPDKADKKQDVFLEIKKKEKNNVFKQRARIEEETAREFIKHPEWEKIFIKKPDVSAINTLKEVDYLRTRLQLKPTLIISYMREPYVSADNLNVRVTFDSDVRYRQSGFSLTAQSMDKHVLSPRHVIMEVKYTEYLPRLLLQILHKHGCNVRTFSKYGIGMEHLLGEQEMLMVTTR